MRKIDGLEELWRWVLNTDNFSRQNQPPIFQPQIINQVVNTVKMIADAIKDDYPFYANNLPQIVKNVFTPIGGGLYRLNIAAFGELYIITKHLHSEPQDTSAWSMIHPRVVLIAKEEFLDGHYASAANRSFVEIETRLRELFKELKPGGVIELIIDYLFRSNTEVEELSAFFEEQL